ncbi:hypothetical protein INT44_003559 [Umbelopsis vinacea]|uniref:Uncharacterized protein n=1 Tax=Umbelopsis vinacea TaxID=44442 RepID=A0A8H7PVK2_9FUNG|nr:hypothetical protein INT44_003559 [Umbelopsis vinacea]
MFDVVPKKTKVMRKFPVSSIFERFALGIVGPLPTSVRSNQHMMVASEHFTKWPIIKTVPKTDQEATAHFLYEEIYAQFGPPMSSSSTTVVAPMVSITSTSSTTSMETLASSSALDETSATRTTVVAPIVSIASTSRASSQNVR